MEILQTTQVYEYTALGEILLISLITLSIVAIVLTVLAQLDDNDEAKKLTGITLLVLAILDFSFYFFSSNTIIFKHHVYDEYVVRLEETYPVSEIYNEYDGILQKEPWSEIYHLKKSI